MPVKLTRIGHSELNVTALAADLGSNLPAQPVLENQGFGIPEHHDLQLLVRASIPVRQGHVTDQLR